MTKINALVVGSGGREHALAWSLTKSPKVNSVYVAPGNAGTELDEKIQNVPIDPMNFQALSDFALRNNCGLTIVGPETPLVRGIVNHFEKIELPCFGPSMEAAQLEGSKAFSKDFMNRHDIPTGRSMTFSELTPALEYIQSIEIPIVIKADGLAAGKGVIVAETRIEAEKAAQDMLAGNVFGEAGHRVIVEEFLEGEEASFIVVVDGEKVLPLATSQDHKRIGDNDTGPNTGGMGAYSPAPIVNENLEKKIISKIVKPTLQALKNKKKPYTGFLYVGLMIINKEPYLIEYNVRMGDPECQVILPRLNTDLVKILNATINNSLNKIKINWKKLNCMTVVLCSKGYPGKIKKNKLIRNIDKLKLRKNSFIFHAGTKLLNNKLVSNGGRVLNITSTGKMYKEIRKNIFKIIKMINWKYGFYRKDIGWRVI